MLRNRWLWMTSAVTGLAVAVTAAGSAQAVQRMYQGQMRIGFGDGFESPLETSPMGGIERIDTANNAVPPCAVPGLEVTPSGMHNPALPLTTMGFGPATGIIDFYGLADVQLTASGAIDPDQPIQFQSVSPTPAGLNNWGLVTSCPAYTNGVPGGTLFRRTQMATFSWPAGSATMRNGRGAVVAGTALTATQAVGAQKIGAMAGPNRFGGSVALLGNGDTLLGFNSIPAFGLPSAIGVIPVPLAIGVDGGLTTMGATIPTVQVSSMAVFKVVTDPVNQRQPGGPVPGTAAPNYPFQGFATGLGFRWTTGVVTAYDNLGDFRTTRTRTGAANFNPTGMTSASLQLVAPSILRLGVQNLTTLGIAVTSELSLKFVPEPASAAMIGVGAGAVALLLVRERRRHARR